MSTIWIVNQYASTPTTGTSNRHVHLARELGHRGHDVYVIAGQWHHKLTDEKASLAAPPIEHHDGYNYVRVPVRRYGHGHDRRRILNWLVFGWRLSRIDRLLPGRPDAVLYSSPGLLGYVAAERLARRLGARLVFEVRDIRPLTLVEIGGISPDHPLIRLMQRIEDRAYRNADRVISNLSNAVEHMVSRGMDPAKFAYISHGFSLRSVEETEPLPEETRQRLPQGKFIVGYAGAMGLSNFLEAIVDAAERLRAHDDIAFVLVGKGRKKEELEQAVARRKLTNVHFIDPIPKTQVQSMLKEFDACIMAARKSPIYRFGKASSKLSEYLISGRPILHSYSGPGDPVVAYDAGISTEAENPEALAEAVLKLHDMPAEERRRMGENGRRGALENHEFARLAEKLEAVLLD